ncbi:MarR family transcriptional regulator [Halegenticoccus soli]|uniref:MarR family transcriptional regulator n=1 Tax=Halegenticoccus soli TaxID=1985678 RepID=UPI003742E7AC
MITITNSPQSQTIDTKRNWLRHAPPSVKLVYWVLERDGPASPQTLLEATLLPKRTIRDAVADLDAAGLIERRPNPFDARSVTYHPVESNLFPMR